MESEEPSKSHFHLLNNYSSALIIVIVICLSMRTHSIETSGNNAWMFHPVQVKFPKTIQFTPQDHLVDSLDIRINSKQGNYEYSECAPGMNGTLRGPAHGIYTKCIPPLIDDISLTLHTTILTIRDVYSSLFGAWAFGNEVVLNEKPSKSELYAITFQFKKSDGVAIYHVNELVILGSYHANCQNMCHFLMDDIAPLMALPTELFERVYIAYSDAKQYVESLMKPPYFSETH